jgi:pyruvate,water dikinase
MIAKAEGTDGRYEAANAWMDVPENLRETQKLTDAEIRELARIGRSVEEHYGHHQDINWAYEDVSSISPRARPVTTMKVGHDDEDRATKRERPSCSAASPPALASASE